MSHSDPVLVSAIIDWLEESESQQLDRIASQYDPEADISLRGQSVRLSLRALVAECEYGDDIASGLPTSEDELYRGSVERAVKDAISDRLEEGEVGDPSEDGWAIEWVDPLDEMVIDISQPLSHHTDELVAVKGRIRQMTDPMPWFRTRQYRCTRCLTAQINPIRHHPRDKVAGRVKEPHECANESCTASNEWETVVEDSDKRDYQYISVEQPPDGDGSTPSKIPCWIFGEGRLTDAAEGERVTIVGRLRLNPDSEPAEHYIDVSAVSTDREDDTVEVDKNDRESVRELVDSTDDVLQTVAQNLAPQVHGNDLAKRGLVLGSVGSGLGDPEEQTHIMLIGDPGTAKTELTKAVREVVPSTRKASLTQSSSVGLTASAVKESVAGGEEWVIRAGALSLASGGILTIDELDEADFDLSKLNDALSEGEIPIDKGGQSTQIRTDTRVIATANPDGAEFDPSGDLGEQIGFSADVVSRFDLAFPFIDEPDDEEMNRGIMQATGADYLDEDELTEEYEEYTRDIDLDTLQKWVAVAQEHQPRITAEAMDEINDAWMLFRESESHSAISINARRLRTVVRLARAHARLRLGDEVTSGDAQTAFRVVSEMLAEWDYDIEDGGNKLSEGEREDVAEMARKTDDSPEEIRTHLHIPDSAADEVESIVSDERGSLGEELAEQRELATDGGEDDE